MTLDFDNTAWLLLLPLALLPWLWHGQRRLPWDSIGALPRDPSARMLDIGLRALASLAIVAALLGLAGMHGEGQPIERVGTGAHIVIALDRSASMADGFAGSEGAADQAKGVAASRLLTEFISSRPRDMFGVTYFSTAPLHALTLTADHDAVRAAIAASASPGAGLTNIAAGLTMALNEFRDQPRTGSRVILLVSDGAAYVDPRAQAIIRRLFQEYRAELYWIFLRTSGGSSPTQPPSADAGPDLAPEYHLDLFFRDLGVPYRLYEADNPRSLEKAIDDVSRLQNMPLRYIEQQPRRDLYALAYWLATACALALLAARVLELRRW